MDKKTIIITGANSGLGFETAKLITKNHDFSVILACRNAKKAEMAKEHIIAETGNKNVSVMLLDLASFDSICDFADAFKQLNIPLYGLINNAGISGKHTGLTADGIDCVFQSNHLGHFLLTNLLFPSMKEDARIISVSSDMHCPPQGELVWMNAESLAYPNIELGKSLVRYSYSKMCNIYFIYELANKLEKIGSQISANVFNPGLMIETNFMPGNTKDSRDYIKKTMPHRVGDIVKSSVALAKLITEPEYGKTSGNYYDRSTHTAQSSPLSYNQTNAAQLWKDSARLCGITGKIS